MTRTHIPPQHEVLTPQDSVAQDGIADVQWIRLEVDNAPIAARSQVETAMLESIVTAPPQALPNTNLLDAAACTRWHSRNTAQGVRVGCDVVLNATRQEIAELEQQLSQLGQTHNFVHAISPVLRPV